MDRDTRWERIEKAYNAISLGQGEHASSALAAVQASYERKITDEFVEPTVIVSAPIGPKDGLIFWNFREDRMREIVRALAVQEFSGFSRKGAITPADRVLCFTDYDHTYHLPSVFEPLTITNHLGEVLANNGLTQLRVAETEKYPHVTYFFNGGIETAYQGEERKMLPSPRDVKTYDQKPEMAAREVANTVIEGIRSGNYDFIAVNFANCDMVGHTGVVDAGVKAVETVDSCLGEVLKELHAKGGQAIILADHGNAEQMINYEDGTPHTSHTTYPVPCVLVDVHGVKSLREGGALCDIAPTVLKMIGIAQPREMTGEALY